MCDCNGSNAVKLKDPSIDVTLLKPTLEKYRDIEGSIITILQKAQDLYGYLPIDLIAHIAKETKIKPAKIHGIVTFYTQFRMTPVGKYVILLCQGTACHVNGSGAIEDAICDELNINEGETTEDGLFTLCNVACLGCCSLAPVMMINGETYGILTPDSTREILKEIRANDN